MELTLRITDPADLTRFAGLLSSIFDATPPAQIPTPAPVTKPRGLRAPTVTAEPTVEEPTTPNPAPAATEVETTVEQMRALAVQKGQANEANKAKIKEIVTELGSTAISNIPADHRAEFIERVNAL